MMNMAYFKRIKYEKEDIATKPFNGLSYDIKEKNVIITPIAEYVEKSISAGAKENLDRVFYYDKSEREKNCGLGKLYTDEALEKCNTGYHIKFDSNYNSEHGLMIKFHLDSENNAVFEKSYIEVAEGAHAKLILYYDSEAGVDGYRNAVISIDIADNASLDLIRVQNLGEECRNFETVKIHMGYRSNFNNYPIEIGSKINSNAFTYYVPKEWAQISAFPLYLIDGERKMDLEQTIVINGKNSLCEISAKGALKDTAKKVFRGNIFLNRGCKRSIGRFGDSDILLNKGVSAHSIPTIMCDEDDVIGEHAASFEPVNRSKLYYLTSRGISELDAKKLMISSNFRPVLDMIEDDVVREYLNEELDRRLQF